MAEMYLSVGTRFTTLTVPSPASLPGYVEAVAGMSTPTPTPTPAPVPTVTPMAFSTVSRLPRPSSAGTGGNTAAATPPTNDATMPTVAPLTAATSRMVVIDPTTEYQRYDGVGLQLQHATRYNFEQHLTPTQADQVLTDVFVGGRVNFIRGYLGSGVFLAKYKQDGQTADYYTLTGPVSEIDARDPALGWQAALSDLNFDRQMEEFGYITKLALAKNPTAKVFISVATPPAWMKTGYNTTQLDSKNLPAVGTAGKFNSAFTEIHMRYICEGLAWHFDNDIPVYSVAIQNEPEVTGAYPTCEWTPAQLRAAVKMLKPMMALPEYNTGKRSLSTVQLWIGECNYNASSTMIRGITSDAEALALIDAAAAHGYHYGSQAEMLKIPANLPWHQTEVRTLTTGANSNADLWNEQVFRTFRNNASSTSMFVLALDENGNPTTNNLNRRGIIITPTDNSGPRYQSEYYLLTQMGKYTTPGGRRVYTNESVTATDIRQVAFRNPNGTVTLHAFNQQSSTTRTIDVISAITGEVTTLSLGGHNVVSTVLNPGVASGARALAPTGLTASGSDTQVALSWSLPADVARRGIIIERGLASGVLEVINVRPADATSFVDTTVTTGTGYFYQVRAFGNGRSDPTAEVAATTTGAAAPVLGNITIASIAPSPKVGVASVVTISGRYSSATTETLRLSDSSTLNVASDSTVTWTPSTFGAFTLSPLSVLAGASNSPYESPSIDVIVAEANTAPVAQPFYSDQFTGTAGAPLTDRPADIGGAYTQNAAAASVIRTGSGGAIYAAGIGNVNSNAVEPDNYDIEGTFPKVTADGTTTGFLMRSSDTTDTCYACTYNSSTGVGIIQRRANGNGATIGGGTLTRTKVIASGETLKIKVQVRKPTPTTQTFRMFMDGEEVGFETESTLLTGKVGVRVTAAPTANRGAQLSALVATATA